MALLMEVEVIVKVEVVVNLTVNETRGSLSFMGSTSSRSIMELSTLGLQEERTHMHHLQLS